MTSFELSILKDALLIAGVDELNCYRSLHYENVEFSKEFKKSIKEINRKRKRLSYKCTKTVPRRIGTIFIAAIITFCLMMTISAFRTPVINFFVNVYDDFVALFFKEDESVYVPEFIDHVNEPTYMIDGFEKVDYLHLDNVAETYWEKDYDLIILYQEIIEQDLQIKLDNSHDGYSEAILGRHTVYYSLSKGSYMFIWSDGSYFYTLILPESIPFDEIEKVISSMP